MRRLFFTILIMMGCFNLMAQHVVEAPLGKEVVIDGEIGEEEWEGSERIEMDGHTIHFRKSATHLFIGVPIDSHKELTGTDEDKKRLTYVEIYTYKKKGIENLHASSMTGRKPYGAETAFKWGDFDDWKSNTDLVRRNNKDATCTAYEYAIDLTYFDGEELKIAVAKLPFYTDNFPTVIIPKQEDDSITQWITIK